MFCKRFIVTYFPVGHLSEYFYPRQGKGIQGIKANLILKNLILKVRLEETEKKALLAALKAKD